MYTLPPRLSTSCGCEVSCWEQCRPERRNRGTEVAPSPKTGSETGHFTAQRHLPLPGCLRVCPIFRILLGAGLRASRAVGLRIEPLAGQSADTLRRVAVLLKDTFVAWPESWNTLAEAEEEVAAALGEDRIAFVALDDDGEPLGWIGGISSYHVGQIVYVAKSLRGDRWRYLSIPPGQSEAFRASPSLERALNHERGKAKP